MQLVRISGLPEAQISELTGSTYSSIFPVVTYYQDSASGASPNGTTKFITLQTLVDVITSSVAGLDPSRILIGNVTASVNNISTSSLFLINNGSNNTVTVSENNSGAILSLATHSIDLADQGAPVGSFAFSSDNLYVYL